MNAKEQEDDPRKWDPWKKVKIQKKQRKIFCIHPCKYCPVLSFFEGFCVPHTAGFCLPCFLASMVFCSPEEAEAFFSLNETNSGWYNNNNNVGNFRAINHMWSRECHPKKRVYSVSMTHPDFLLSRLLVLASILKLSWVKIIKPEANRKLPLKAYWNFI